MKKSALLILILLTTSLFAQRGKNGNQVISKSQVVNEYTTVTADITAGATSITVANSSLNTKGRFTTNLAAGDLVMIIQMQGATINGALTSKYVGNANTATPNDSSWGAITAYNNCGNYELAQVTAVPNATTIQFDCGLANAYTAAGRVQVIRLPRYNTLTVNIGDTVKCDPWDSAKGGVVAIEVLGNTILNSNALSYGVISASGLGFRGGALSSTMDSSDYGVNNSAVDAFLMAWAKLKGEGIAGYGWSYDQYGGRYGRGAAANAGGGGDAHNAGGGGGANGGTPSGWINGDGDPDVTTANNVAAWKLEYSWLSTFKGSGGGRGGYTFSSKINDPTKDGPNNLTNWGGDQRRVEGGLGGRPLDYTTGKIFMGGGGGAGDQDNNVGGAGGNGGGIVYLVSYGTISGGGQINANGAVGDSSNYIHSSNAGDGAGGGGGGGAIIINSVGNIGGITVNANGGKGGNQIIGNGTPEAEGPGGGGGGGYIATSNTGYTITANGAANGVTSSLTMTKFPADGATAGGTGINNAVVTNFHIVAVNDTICNGQTATLTASLAGTVPGGTTLSWYSTFSGGSVIGTGTTYTTTGPITKDTVIYVGTACPYTYRQPVNIIVNGSSSISVSPPASVCAGQPTNLTAAGGTAYTWKPATGLSNSTIANPVATPTATITYTVFITTPCGQLKDSVTITVTPAPSVTFTGKETICKGASTTITANGGTSYSWTPATGLSSTNIANPVASPTATTTYSVTVTNSGCPKDTTVNITVNNPPSVSVNPPSASICTGGSVTLTASNATTYTWSPNTAINTTTGASVTVSPSGNTTYTVVGATAGCTDTVKVPVTVGGALSVSVTASKDTICQGSSTTLTATGGGTYKWSDSAKTASTTVNPAVPTTYKVMVSSGSCKDSATITIHVSPSFKPTITGNNSICTGQSTTLTATGGGTYLWDNGLTTASIKVTPLADSTYSVKVTNGACSPDTSVTVAVNPMPTPTISKGQTICEGTPATLTAGGGTTYTWSNGSTGATISVTPAKTTNYIVTVANGGCIAKDSTLVTVDPTPVGTATGSTTIVGGQSTPITVLPVASGETYSWSPSTGLSCTSCANPTATPSVTTTYSVLIADSAGCTKADSVTITVNENCGQIFVPEAFSPGQAKNNVLYVRGDCIQSMEFEVFDRWGNRVFESTNPSSGWDGDYNGKPMNSGTYVYYLHATSVNNITIDQKGNITLVR